MSTSRKLLEESRPFTPSSSIEPSRTSISAKDKEAVDAAAGGTYCLIGHTPLSMEHAHVIPRRMYNDQEALANLKRAWNIKSSHLSLNTPGNIIILQRRLHRLFDQGKWMLIPDRKVIQRYYDALEHPRFPFIAAKRFSYRFIPHSDLVKFPIFQQEGINVQILSYPYGNLTITSHLQPRFAIIDAGRKLASQEHKFFASDPNLLEDLDKISTIYMAWTSKPAQSVIRNKRSKDLPSGRKLRPIIHPYAKKTKKKTSSDTEMATSSRVHSTRFWLEGYRSHDEQVCNPSKCLITGMENVRGCKLIDNAHLLRRASPKSLLTRLADHWREIESGLDVNVPFNIIPLDTTIHHIFDQGLLLLLPLTGTLNTINKYYQARRIHYFPKFPDEIYEYRLLGHPDLTGTSMPYILEGSIDLHEYPFTDFPVIQSTAHPKFIICNIGSKMEQPGMLDSYKGAYPHHAEALQLVHDIYGFWKAPHINVD
ncbi:hypothetical protein BDN70DRAFT_707974 [Pholiota conissans]|uniref:HNH nuclease domain-containing protein n=1 Tax=Pholiota conissans TaxID=109636 RepID=A0A9P5ZCC2_9AGAR|nr:hypothetical protein BDN70DRAFT_707974 [Pholiota conissans]